MAHQQRVGCLSYAVTERAVGKWCQRNIHQPNTNNHEYITPCDRLFACLWLAAC